MSNKPYTPVFRQPDGKRVVTKAIVGEEVSSKGRKRTKRRTRQTFISFKCSMSKFVFSMIHNNLLLILGSIPSNLDISLIDVKKRCTNTTLYKNKEKNYKNVNFTRN